MIFYTQSQEPPAGKKIISQAYSPFINIEMIEKTTKAYPTITITAKSKSRIQKAFISTGKERK